MDNPTESGYYFHTNGHGNEEIVHVEFSMGGFWIRKINADVSYHLSEDKGIFGERILLPSEEE